MECVTHTPHKIKIKASMITLIFSPGGWPRRVSVSDMNLLRAMNGSCERLVDGFVPLRCRLWRVNDCYDEIKHFVPRDWPAHFCHYKTLRQRSLVIVMLRRVWCIAIFMTIGMHCRKQEQLCYLLISLMPRFLCGSECCMRILRGTSLVTNTLAFKLLCTRGLFLLDKDVQTSLSYAPDV